MNEKDFSLGFIIDNVALLDSVEIPAEFFRTGHQHEAWNMICELRQAGDPITFINVAEKCPGNGIPAYLTAITSGLYPIKPEEFRRRILKQRAEDVKARMIGQIEKEAKAGAFDYDSIVSMVEEARALEIEAENGTGQASPLLSFPELRAMDLRVEWVIDGLVPENAVTFFYGRTTVGKTWLGLMMAEAVSAGVTLFGKPTRQRPVIYVDLENPLANVKERADALQMRSMAAQLWHSTMTPRPPKLDSPDWTLYKAILPVGSLVFFDTRRSLHDGKENDDDVAALVMNRCQELRDGGRSVIILSHPTKANDRDLRGSGAWADLADHTLQFYKVRARGDAEDEGGEILPGSLLCLATGKKTRFAPVSPIYLTLTDHGLELSEDPDAEAIDALAEIIAGPGYGKNQGEVIRLAKEADLGGSKHRQRLIHLLARGEREGRWTVEEGLRGAKLYRPATEELKP